MHKTLGFAAGLMVTVAAFATPADDAWLNDDSEFRAEQVNEGTLVFLRHQPAKPTHHHENHIVITRDSLRNGWIRLTQCHEHLDAVPRAQVVYNKHRIRNLRITVANGIERAWIEGASVQLVDIGHHARLCVSAESRALWKNPDGSYSLRNGPFMRRFLDGFYPLHVSMSVEYPHRLLKFESISPRPQTGFRFWKDVGGLHYDTWFEGKLRTDIRFEPVG
ncbi:MAG: hypothetical protein P8Y64_02860 [Gammaproteobacteria bacterium]|jgi:hypothetical protein